MSGSVSQYALFGSLRRWSHSAMGTLERCLLLGALGYAVLLIVARTARAGSPPTTVVVVASATGVALAAAALVPALARGAALHGGDEWTQRTAAMRGTRIRQRWAIIRALREEQPVAAQMREPALAYTWLRGAADRQVWMLASIALMQASVGGGEYDVVPHILRLVLVVLCALMATVVVLNSARWRRIRATFTVEGGETS